MRRFFYCANTINAEKQIENKNSGENTKILDLKSLFIMLTPIPSLIDICTNRLFRNVTYTGCVYPDFILFFTILQIKQEVPLKCYLRFIHRYTGL